MRDPFKPHAIDGRAHCPCGHLWSAHGDAGCHTHDCDCMEDGQ